MYQIAKQQSITAFHAWRVYHKYKGVKKPKLLPCGRKPRPIYKEEIELVKNTHKETLAGAVNMEKILAERGIGMPHNKIHKILISEGLANKQPNKSRKRKWVRYERKRPNSLWHADFFEYKGKQHLLYEDDASRLVTGFAQLQIATTERAIMVFDRAAEKWGIPKQLMTDHGSQFCTDEEKEFAFRNHLESKRVKHILARIKHPQSNGKLERLVQTIKYLMSKGMTFEEAVKFYNEKRPHMSLENGHLRTPLQAFYEKLRGVV